MQISLAVQTYSIPFLRGKSLDSQDSHITFICLIPEFWVVSRKNLSGDGYIWRFIRVYLAPEFE